MPLLSYGVALIAGLLMGNLVGFISLFFIEKEGMRFTRCQACHNSIKWYDTSSTVSFLLLKGRCRSCGAKINSRYFLIELLNGISYMIVFMANGWNFLSILYCLMTSAFLVISIVDWLTYEIPLPCNIFLGAVGVVACIFDFKNLLSHVIGFFAISIALYLLFIISKGAAIGGGDVKLMAVAGLILGWKLVILAFFLGCIIGSVCHVIRMRVSKAERVLAMGPYLCMGLWICALWGNEMISWYLGRLGL